LLKGEDAVRTYAELLRTCSGCEYEKAAQYETALTFYRMGKYAEAVDAALRVKLDPSVKKDAYWLLAESYAGLGKEDEAIQYYGLLLRDFPDSDVSCDATYRLAHHLQKRGENKEASRYYDELAATFPKSDLAPQALYASALCLVQERMFEEAIRDWSTLVRTYPSHSLVEESLYRKAMAEIRARQDREAAATLDELLKRFPKTRYLAEARYWLGVLLAGAGKLPEAEEQLRQAAQAGPGPELTRRCEYQLAVTLQKEQKFKEAAERFQKLLGAPQEDEFSPALLEWLAGFRCENGAYKEALAAARLLIARYSEPAWQQIGWGLAGRASLGEGDRAGAQQAFSRAMEQKATTPLAAESSLRLGELMLATNRLADAERHFQDAARLSSDDSLLGIRVRAYHGLALAAKAAGNGQEAARYFMSVAVLFDDPELVPESLYEAAAAYRSIGNDPDSKKALDELVKRYPQSAWAKRAAPQGSP
jgi:TolA-binding protein